MARCQRCNACESQWDFTPCRSCGFPGVETRTPEMIAQDEKDWKEYVGGD